MRRGRARRRQALAAAAATAALALLLAWVLAVGGRPYPAALLEPRRAASLTVLDAQGTVLRQLSTDAGGRESWVPLSRISPHLALATIASEDHRFFFHAGVDWPALVRAALLNLSSARLAFGGSTLTMQLTRLLEPRPRSLRAKLAELALAARLERTLDKAQILEQYLNRVYYGCGAWGAESAARLYFGKPAAALSVGEAAFLAVLPRGPEAYHPYRNLEAALARRSRVLALMERRGFLAADDRALAERSPLQLRRDRPGFRAPHFVDHLLGAELAGESLRGATVHTTLDGPLQLTLEVALRRHLARVGWLHIGQAALVVLRNSDGAILSMVGSRDYFDQRGRGAVNAAVALHRPGSTLKPYVYGLALERGDTAASVAYDVILPEESGQSYTREVRQHGFARYRESLAGSYNLAAVHTLARVGVPALVERLRRGGLRTLPGPDDGYRLDLAIGEAEVRLLELTAAFAVFGRGGRALSPHGLASIRWPDGARREAARRPGRRVFSPGVAYLIHDILSDPDARRPMFGDAVPMQLPFRVAMKTGTTRGYTDNWALGTTADYTIGVWAGNFDGSPTSGVMSVRGAVPLLRDAFAAVAARFGEPGSPARPAGIVEAPVCPTSGLAPGPHCGHRKRELFLAGSEPRRTCDWHVHECGRTVTRYPGELWPWLRARRRLPEPGCQERLAGAGALRILYPRSGAQFSLDPYRAAAQQIPPLRAEPPGAEVRWTVDGIPVERWRPSPGAHRIEAELDGQRDEVSVRFE